MKVTTLRFSSYADFGKFTVFVKRDGWFWCSMKNKDKAPVLVVVENGNLKVYLEPKQ